jgi:hypothetical protein
MALAAAVAAAIAATVALAVKTSPSAPRGLMTAPVFRSSSMPSLSAFYAKVHPNPNITPKLRSPTPLW